MTVRHVAWVVAAAIALGVALLLFTSAVGAGDLARGKMLYEARCVGCHDKSVHNRTARKAMNVEAIRAQVVRWDAAMGGAWREPEVDDVTTYLNELYIQVCVHAGDLPGTEDGPARRFPAPRADRPG
jgi:mono/diheme cytochrome c family protein